MCFAGKLKPMELIEFLGKLAPGAEGAAEAEGYDDDEDLTPPLAKHVALADLATITEDDSVWLAGFYGAPDSLKLGLLGLLLPKYLS